MWNVERFTLLLFSGFVAYGWSKMNGITRRKYAPSRTQQNAQTRLFQYVNVVVVRISHGPTRSVTFCFFAIRRVYQATVAISPLFPQVEIGHLKWTTLKNIRIQRGNGMAVAYKYFRLTIGHIKIYFYCPFLALILALRRRSTYLYIIKPFGQSHSNFDIPFQNITGN